MKISVESGDIKAQQVDAIVVNLFEGVTSPGGGTGAVDKALDGAISGVIADGETRGKLGEMTLIHTMRKLPARRVAVVGLGKSADFDADVVRRVTGVSSRYLRGKGVKTIATIAHGAGIGGMDARTSGQGIAEGALLGAYRFDKYKTKDSDHDIDELRIVEFNADKVADLEAGVAEGTLLAEATILCRDMANEPANEMTPTRMAEVAAEVAAESGLEVEVLDRDQMAELGMGALLGVAQGSLEPPKLIVLKYQGDPDDPANNLGLLGKGITFDTGGISIKPAAGMGDMKGDMAGGAAVISAMKAIGTLKPRINVTGIVAATENMPGGNAQRPGDVVKTMNGKTIEIDNTDAEGRLVLADAAGYARSLDLTRLVDVATLTGAMRIALGTVYTGVFGNDQPFVDRVMAAGKSAGERMWQLPIDDDFKSQYKSDVADIKNTGGRAAGSITGAMIIGEFTEGAAWAHLDIAGTSETKSTKGYKPKGATGVGVRSLVTLALDLAKD